MENYKKKLYIIDYLHITAELRDIYKESKELFDKTKCESLLKVRIRIKDLTHYVESIPTFGESEVSRKKKNSMYYEFKKYILVELTLINDSINNALESSKGKVIKYANTLESIERLGKKIQTFKVYHYNTEKENETIDKYNVRFKKYKESIQNGSIRQEFTQYARTHTGTHT